jgi:hypothetical protein
MVLCQQDDLARAGKRKLRPFLDETGHVLVAVQDVLRQRQLLDERP